MASGLSPEQRSLRASIAANTKWAKTDPVAGTAKARSAYHERFLDAVDPDRQLPDAERERRARALLRAHMQRLSFASAKARRRRAEK